MATLYEKQLQILRLIRDATNVGLFQWQQSETDKDWYFSKTGPIENAYIHFKWPAYNGEVGSDRDFVEVSGSRFMIGTEGFELALEILAAAFPDWKGHNAGLHDAYNRKIASLTNALHNASK